SFGTFQGGGRKGYLFLTGTIPHSRETALPPLKFGPPPPSSTGPFRKCNALRTSAVVNRPVFLTMNDGGKTREPIRKSADVHCTNQSLPLCPSIAATVPISCSHCALKRSHCAHQMLLPLCPSIVATVPSNAATAPINCCHCAHQLQPLCPSIAATVPINCSHCALKRSPSAHQMLPLCLSIAATVPINCSHCALKRSHCAHQMLPLCPSIVATVPINCSHCAIKCQHCAA
ncbi:hypothetical protein AB205_0109880, partial [Aquarana catesbeiana]